MAAATPDNVVVPSYVPPPSPWGTVDPANVIAVIFAIVFIWWAIYTLIAIYHWLRFGRTSWAALPSIVLHLFVSVWLLIFITSGLH